MTFTFRNSSSFIQLLQHFVSQFSKRSNMCCTRALFLSSFDCVCVCTFCRHIWYWDAHKRNTFTQAAVKCLSKSRSMASLAKSKEIIADTFHLVMSTLKWKQMSQLRYCNGKRRTHSIINTWIQSWSWKFKLLTYKFHIDLYSAHNICGNYFKENDKHHLR